MGLAETSREELFNILVGIVLSDKPLHVIRCTSHAEATRLRLRLNKVRIADRKANLRAQIRDRVPTFEQRETSQFDKLVFQILAGSAEIFIHKQEYATDSILDNLYAGTSEQDLEKVRRANIHEEAIEVGQSPPTEDLEI